MIKLRQVNNQKGQSLVELATFGSILLFCLGVLIQYGMEANYQQNLQMQNFRKAMRAAYYKSGPGAGVSLSRIEDKPIPDPRDPWGVPERRPVSASASVMWDPNAQALYVDRYSETPDTRDLPRSIIEINNTLGLSEASLNVAGINSIDSNQGAFTTAAYDERSCNGYIDIVLEEPDRLASHEEYRLVRVPCSDIKVKNRKSKDEDPDREIAYFRPAWGNGLTQTVSSADVDRDGQVETIIAVGGNQACDNEGYCGTLQNMRYVDYQQGEINSELTQILPWETNKSGADINAQQGLLYESRVGKAVNNTLIKRETPTRLETTTTVGGAQTVIHYIRTNDGRRTGYLTPFPPATLESHNMGVNK